MKTILLLFSILTLTVSTNAQRLIERTGKTTIDISKMSSVDTTIFSNEYKVGTTISIQLVYRSITGTVNGSISFYQTNKKGVPYVQLPALNSTFPISQANGTAAFTKQWLEFALLPMVITKNGMTGGFIDIYYNVKQY